MRIAMLSTSWSACRARAPTALCRFCYRGHRFGRERLGASPCRTHGSPGAEKRTSDLLNPFVGGTERNIANAFAEARDTDAFLVFDEADSLLLDRADAVRSWEISQINEMLGCRRG